MTVVVYFPGLDLNTTQHGYGGRGRYVKECDLLKVKGSYSSTVEPLAGLGCLRKFFAYFEDSFHTSNGPNQFVGWALVDRRPFEKEAEALIMGSEYDAIAAGKYKIPESGWMKEMKYDLYS